MAARATGSGTISFGLVAIPVKLYSTVDTTKAVHFNYLSQDGSRLKQQYIRASDGKVIEPGEKVQGYEFQKGQYVTFTPEEMKAMDVEATNAIEIAEFIPLERRRANLHREGLLPRPRQGRCPFVSPVARRAREDRDTPRSRNTRRVARATSCCCGRWPTAS